MEQNFAFVIPVFRHGAALAGVLKELQDLNLTTIVVDDGNNEENKALIKKTVENSKNCILVTQEKNGGKGAAVTSGILKAAELGFTHVFQLDSDGQHNTSKIPRFLELSRENPGSVICGCPEYDADAPQSRVKGREFANMWIHIVTLSKSIKDAMVGFRIYPVEKVVKVLRRTLYINKRMGFDIEILVRLFWANVPIISEPVKISYPKDGVSNFRMFWDNAGISETYTRLFLGMIPRLPIILFNALTRKK
ncbi:glycosyltransferase family 2 protein [bacterium]|nr:glycosyltransferase family 2 protein [bacterium]